MSLMKCHSKKKCNETYINLFDRLSNLRRDCQENQLFIEMALAYTRLVEKYDSHYTNTDDGGTLAQFARWINEQIKRDFFKSQGDYNERF